MNDTLSKSVERRRKLVAKQTMKTGQKEKALEAFKNCLIMGEGVRQPGQFPLKHARIEIEKLKKRK